MKKKAIRSTNPEAEIYIPQSRSSSGVIDNGGFEDFTFTGGDCYYGTDGTSTSTCAFLGCDDRTDWWVSHGTPEIYRDGYFHKALLWSGKWHSPNGDNTIYGEGLFINCSPFSKDKVYNIELDMATYYGDIVDHVYIKLVKGYDMEYIEHGDIDYSVNDNYRIPQISNTQTILHKTNYSSSGENISFSFIPNDDYHVLWIYPLSDNDAYNIPFFYIDNVDFNECEEYEIYNNVSKHGGADNEATKLSNYASYK